MDIVFIVLHYTAVQVTLASIDSIRSHIDTKNYSIVIVDNCSPDDSWIVLTEHFESSADVFLLHSECNLGFARGNNVGYRYAKENLNPDFVVLMNNDVFLFQSDVYHVIKNKYDEYGFAVMGPMIVTADGLVVSNPFRKNLMTKIQALRSLKRYKRLLRLNKIGCDSLYKTLVGRMHSYMPPFVTQDRIHEIENVGLHGSFLIFSGKYLETFDGLDERTFLYMEEDILLLHVLKRGLKTLYSPEIAVFHQEDAATNAIHKNSRQKNAFVYQNCIASLKTYCQIWDFYQS